jgi:hypothetical protein
VFALQAVFALLTLAQPWGKLSTWTMTQFIAPSGALWLSAASS